MLQCNRLRKATALGFFLLMTTNLLAPLSVYASPVRIVSVNSSSYYKAPFAGSVKAKEVARENLSSKEVKTNAAEKEKHEKVANAVIENKTSVTINQQSSKKEEQPTEQKEAKKFFTNQDETLNQANASGVVQAFNSITLDPGFETLTNGDFTAEILGGTIAQSNVPAPSSSTGSTNADINWIMATTYDPSGNPIGQSKKFFDNGGKPLQEQSKVFYRKDASTVYTHVFASQPLYDAYGRTAATTLGAPIDNSSFIYKNNFVQNTSNTVYDYKNFDRYKPTTTETDKTYAPDAVGTASGTLGWYYSTNNTWEPYTPVSSYPYSRQSFYSDGTGNVKKSAGAGEAFKMGSTHEGSSYVTPVVSELSEYVSIRNNYFSSTEFGELPTFLAGKAIQTIGRDANGREALSIQDKDGKTLMVGRPGSELSVSNSTTLKPAYIFNFNGSDIGTAKNLKITGSGSIIVYESQNGGSSYSQVYSGAPGSYTSPSSVPHLYKIESNEAFTVSYDAAITNEPDKSVCKSCPSAAGDNSIYYFKLFASSAVTVTGGSFILYNMETEQSFSFTSGSSLGAGYYKLANTGTTPITLGYSNSYADISYSFYNHLGQLVATIAPEGVKKLRAAGIPSSTYPTKNTIPFITLNEYDVQGRLVSSKDADAGAGTMVYRKDGKIRFSQNAVQAALPTPRYSYTNYDALGRPVESGEYDPQGNGIAFSNVATIIENVSAGGGLTGGVKTDVVVTTYDAEDNSHGQSGYAQDPFYLRGGVSVSRKYSSVSGAPPYGTTNLVSATWYSYDEEGKVTWNIQYITGLGYKTNEFSYDAMSRLTKRVFQKNTAAETFVHYYEYDAGTQQLSKTYTNTVDNSGTKMLQATYQYYLHGPLKRVVLGDATQGVYVQGLDYTYTLQGALKAINNSDKPKDPGGDGSNGVLGDAFGMVLDYYASDYINGRGGAQPFKEVNTSGITADSYTGQIKAMTWFSEKPGASGVTNAPTTYVYKYDDKYQFTESVWGTGLNFSNTPASFTQSSANKEKIPAYDANGNIKSLERNNSLGNATDNLIYYYLNKTSNTGSTTDYNTNKLQKVANTLNSNDDATYSYDDLGQLVAESYVNNANKTKYIRYDVSGKVVAVARDAAFNQRVAEYVYNELGVRIIKRSYTPSTNQLISTTYYVGDVVYTQASGGSIVAQEYEIDGGGTRIGVFFRQANIYAYQLTDHLGNTRAVVAKSGSNLDVRSYSDYYPYGMVIREYKAAEGYRYGYQGQYSEKDGETDWNSFELRMYDSRIARWMQYDPKRQFFSPYVGMGNEPVAGLDPDGGWREYEDADAYYKDNPNGKLDGSDGHWLKSDRVGNTAVWQTANQTNLKAGAFNEYQTIAERAAFYKWFAFDTYSKGFETNWAGAAFIIASNVAASEKAPISWFVSKAVKKFANEGNKAIFDDVFNRLKELYFGPPLKGEAALNWDVYTLTREQFIIVHPLYLKQSSETVDELVDLAKVANPTFKGNILNASDRYNYGMGPVTNYWKKYRDLHLAYKGAGWER
jgi:RHS repeat-associated protein